METPSDFNVFGSFLFLENGIGQLVRFPAAGDLKGYLVLDHRSGEYVQLQTLETNDDSLAAILHASTWRQAEGDFPVIPKLLDCGIDDNIPYYAAEIPEGEPLYHYLNRAQPWSVEAAARGVLKLVREFLDKSPFCIYRYAISLQSVWLERASGLPRLMMGDLWLDARPDAPFRNAALFARILTKLTGGNAEDPDFVALCEKIENSSGTLEYIEQSLGEYLERFRYLEDDIVVYVDQPESYRAKVRPSIPKLDERFQPRPQLDPLSILKCYQLARQRSPLATHFLGYCRHLLVAGAALLLFYYGLPQKAFRAFSSRPAPIAGAREPEQLVMVASLPSFDPPSELLTENMKVEERLSLLHQTIQKANRKAGASGSQLELSQARAEEARHRNDYFTAVRHETEVLNARPRCFATQQRLDGDLFRLFYSHHGELKEEEREILRAAADFNSRALAILQKR